MIFFLPIIYTYTKNKIIMNFMHILFNCQKFFQFRNFCVNKGLKCYCDTYAPVFKFLMKVKTNFDSAETKIL